MGGNPGADIVDSPFTTTVLPGPTSAVRASGSLRWIMANQPPNPPPTQRPEVDSLITGTGLQYAEAGVEARKKGPLVSPPMGDGCDPRVILTVLVVDSLSSLG